MFRRGGLALLGLYVGVLAAVIHQHQAGGIPWGLVAALVIVWLVARGAAHVLALGVAWFGLGWAISLLALQFAPGGGYVIASDWVGWTYTVGCMGVLIFAALRTPRLGQ